MHVECRMQGDGSYIINAWRHCNRYTESAEDYFLEDGPSTVCPSKGHEVCYHRRSSSVFTLQLLP